MQVPSLPATFSFKMSPLHVSTLYTRWSIITPALLMLLASVRNWLYSHRPPPNPAVMVMSPLGDHGPVCLLPWQPPYLPSIHLPTFTCASGTLGYVTDQIKGRPPHPDLRSLSFFFVSPLLTLSPNKPLSRETVLAWCNLSATSH